MLNVRYKVLSLRQAYVNESWYNIGNIFWNDSGFPMLTYKVDIPPNRNSTIHYLLP